MAFILLAACGGMLAAGPRPRVLDAHETCGSMRTYLVADRDGWYVVELREGTAEQALAAVEGLEPMPELEALARFEALREGRP